MQRRSIVPFLLTVLSMLGEQVNGGRAMGDETSLPADGITTRDIVYVTRNNGPVKLDLLRPPGDGPFPLVLWMHGGAWKMGSKSSWPHMNFLVRHGFAVGNVEYRFSQVAPFPAQLDDCRAALEFLIDHATEYHLDPNRIAATGESAGGQLASLLGMSHALANTQPLANTGRIAAVIDLFGPTDLAALEKLPSLTKDVDQLLGGPAALRAEEIHAGSPILQVASTDPPFLIFHGTKDPLVPFEQSQRLCDALKTAGVFVEFVPVVDAGHAGPAFWTEPMQTKMVAFLKRTLHLE